MCTDAYREALTRDLPSTAPSAPASTPAPSQRHATEDGREGTLTRNELRFPGTPAPVPVLTEPTCEQREAFDLIAAPIPLTLRK